MKLNYWYVLVMQQFGNSQLKIGVRQTQTADLQTGR